MLKVREALKQGRSIDEVHRLTKIDPWFLNQIKSLTIMDHKDSLRLLKENGFSDTQLARAMNKTEMEVRRERKNQSILPSFKVVDTCAAEFVAKTPYCYSTYDMENEIEPLEGKKIVILGGGPNRIGQGIEFDYCCVHAALAVKSEGYEAIMINCNPETVSTDYDTSDRLFFEPLTFEDVMSVIDLEKPKGVIVQFGGQTPLKIANALKNAGVEILGTSPENIDNAEDREKFGSIIKLLGITCPDYGTCLLYTSPSPRD